MKKFYNSSLYLEAKDRVRFHILERGTEDRFNKILNTFSPLIYVLHMLYIFLSLSLKWRRAGNFDIS